MRSKKNSPRKSSPKPKGLKKRRKKKFLKKLIFSIILGFLIGDLFFFLNKNLIVSIVISIIFVILFLLGGYFKEKLSKAREIRKMENVFPDFLQLMSSNLRAGITIDKAMLMSAREEFYPLNQEILKTGRDITTGRDIEKALLDMSKRINSDKISKTVLLIISGIKSGGDIATILEETSRNMRDRSFMEKKAASSVLMYVIFIFIAVAVGAPALFGLSNILVEILTTLLAGIEVVEASNTPFTLSKVDISINFIFYFSIAFILVIDFLASLILGLVSKGQESEGLKFFLPLAVISLTIFLTIKFALAGFVQGFFG